MKKSISILLIIILTLCVAIPVCAKTQKCKLHKFGREYIGNPSEHTHSVLKKCKKCGFVKLVREESHSLRKPVCVYKNNKYHQMVRACSRCSYKIRYNIAKHSYTSLIRRLDSKHYLYYCGKCKKTFSSTKRPAA